MAITPLNSFADVQKFIDQVLTDNHEQARVRSAPHKAFWSTINGATTTYDQFVNGTVPNVTDPNTGNPMPVLVKGNSAQSNLILALQGSGPIFGPDGSIERMPGGGPPFFTADQINSIAAWIDNNCPEFEITTVRS